MLTDIGTVTDMDSYILRYRHSYRCRYRYITDIGIVTDIVTDLDIDTITDADIDTITYTDIGIVTDIDSYIFRYRAVKLKDAYSLEEKL